MLPLKQIQTRFSTNSGSR